MCLGFNGLQQSCNYDVWNLTVNTVNLLFVYFSAVDSVYAPIALEAEAPLNPHTYVLTTTKVVINLFSVWLLTTPNGVWHVAWNGKERCLCMAAGTDLEDCCSLFRGRL
jgi:hypothetical protein